MRKLILFSALGGAFALALVLEHFVARVAPERVASASGDRVVLQLGGGPPRAIPERPADEPRPQPAKPAGRSGERPGLAPPARDAGSVRPSPPSGRTCVVAKHETLSTIARRELGSSARWRDLASWNGIADPSSLREGTVLRLDPPDGAARSPAPAPKPAEQEPLARSHKVAKGETLSRIAARYLGDAQRWREIQTLNRIPDPANVAEGTVLKLPDR